MNEEFNEYYMKNKTYVLTEHWRKKDNKRFWRVELRYENDYGNTVWTFLKEFKDYDKAITFIETQQELDHRAALKFEANRWVERSRKFFPPS